MDRRQFLRRSSAASLAALSARAYAVGGGDKRRVGVIGCGWYGKYDLLQLMHVEPVNVVSLCDVDSQMLDEAADLVASRQASGKRPRTYGNYRDLLAEKDLDIVIVGTPDHWHALPTIEAVEAGAHVYVQKPTAVDVLESKAMVDAARRTGRVIQVGTQRRSTSHLIEAKQRIVQGGLLGDIAHVEAFCYYHMRSKENPPPTNPPSYLDYESWIGPAPARPYNELVHPIKWRMFMEYGNGIVGDMCVHMLDMVRWQLDLGWPKRVSSCGGIMVDTQSIANITDTQTATFEFDDLNVVWTHRTWGTAPDPEFPWAAIIYGSKGTLKLSFDKYEFVPFGDGQRLHGEPELAHEDNPDDEKRWRMSPKVSSANRAHMRDFLQAIDQRSLPVADIEQGHISSSSCFIANYAMKLGRALQFDPDTHTVAGDDEATKMLQRPYRAPYKHPAG